MYSWKCKIKPTCELTTKKYMCLFYVTISSYDLKQRFKMLLRTYNLIFDMKEIQKYILA